MGGRLLSLLALLGAAEGRMGAPFHRSGPQCQGVNSCLSAPSLDCRRVTLAALCPFSPVAFDLCAQLNPCANGGTCSMVGPAWICRCPGRWRGKGCQAGPEPADPLRTLSTLSSGRIKPSHGSWDPGPTPKAPPWHPSLAASGAVEMPTGSTAAGGTSEAGSREPAESLTGQSPPATTVATQMAQAWFSPSVSPAGATVPGSSPSSPSGGFSLQDAATSPSQGAGSGVQVDTRPRMAGPGSEAAWAAGKTTVPPSFHPANSPWVRAGIELAGGQPVTGASLPGPTWPADSAKIPEGDVAALEELTQTGGPEEFPWQPAGSQEFGETGRKLGLHTASTRPPEPWSVVGLLLSRMAPPELRAPPRSSVEPELVEVEAVTLGDLPGSVGPATPREMSLGQRPSVWDWERPALTPSPGVSPAAVRGSEAIPHFIPSSSPSAATSAQSPDFPPYRTGHAPDTSQPVPSPSLPLGHGGLSTGPTGEMGSLGTGHDARGSPPARQTSTDPLTVEPLHLVAVHNTPKFVEPFSTPSSPALAQPPPNWVTEVGTPSKPASSSSGTSAAGTDTASLSSDSQKRASTQASPPAGGTAATAVPTVRLALGRGELATWRSPGPTEFQAGPASAAFATREDSVVARPSQLPTQTGVPPDSHSAVAVSTSRVGETKAFGQFSVTHQAWSLPARTWSWSRGHRSTESPGREAPPSPSLPTAGTTWHAWPPARGDPPVASTWILAVVPKAATQLVPATPREVRPRVQHLFVAENQPPVLKAAFLHLPWELVLAMEFPGSFGSPHSPEYRGLVFSISATVTPLFAPLPGFQRLEVKSIRPGGVVVLLDAVFQAEAPGWWAALNRSGLLSQPPPGLWVDNTSVVVWSLALERPLDLCTELFSCPTGYDCVVGEDRNATCASVCHRQYCKNQGICTHAANQTPICQCPVGSDFWFLGVRCDYRVTQQGLLGVAGGLLLSLLLIGAAIFGLVVRRVRMLLLEARADQTKSSYRRFCRLDDVSAHYWSEPWLASVNSLDNPAFSNSEELLHLQILEPTCCSCQEGCLAAQGHRKSLQGGPSRRAAGRPRSLCSWERSSGSGNEHMIDSGKASEVSVSSWPVEPIQWSPSPALHERARQPTNKSRRPHSFCEGMELVTLERSWTA